MTTTQTTARANGRARAPRVTLDELARDCSRCGHQNGGHTRGGDRDAWWQASGGCAVPGCACPGRTQGAADRPAAAPPAPIVPPPPVASRLTGPCGHGTGPCGAISTRPYAEGPRCAEHAPGGRRQAPPSP